MQEYIESFRRAMDRTNALTRGMSNYPLDIDPALVIDLPAVVSAIAQDFSEFLPHTDVLPGMCFRVARELSYVLFERGVRHTVTVGDVELVDGFYVGVTVDQLLQDVADGYQLDFKGGRPVGKPIHAHAWITLENGCVIDATVLASQHRKSPSAKELLSFEEAVYYTGKPGTPVIRHIPMMTGLVYHQKALVALVDGDLQSYCHWAEDYGKLMSRLDLLRLVSALTAR
ncbi:hypothetical protein ABZQ74_31520 [Pseudomonas aeruginosa]|uniref:hypothetical protein n=1 Tax=Pseudomonas aeruginosa TaxID=287 RepID=UPI000F4FD72E|nr:hypothetical protein [Pseudomonas aeruginosa]EIU2546417.1 hypothetical protein [Pseudomonas aeruginosa]EIU2890621.1 hypothetical protein [Pseudomonas aeruginosa]EIU3160031.1 hypothetical protein [Pseudomonas aeruginosa]EIU3733668.1 hypothetical protein [Pseudomonas aeruginosa]EIU4342092.1 hypothetical protein [Pseudomonas aeruginosa]